MKIEFIWSGHDLALEQKEGAEEAIAEALSSHLSEKAHPPIYVHLFHNLATSTISGVVIDKSGQQVIKVTRSTANDCKTIYEPISSQ
jgi:hypothetical protein